jgi:hypothetical protein
MNNIFVHIEVLTDRCDRAERPTCTQGLCLHPRGGAAAWLIDSAIKALGDVLEHVPNVKIALHACDAAVFRRAPNGQLVYASRLALADGVRWIARVDMTSPVTRKSRAVAQR